MRIETGSPDITLFHGDCLSILPTLEAGSVDAIVTDPPAGIRFMGSAWDTFPTRSRGEDSQFADGRTRPGIAKGQEHRRSDRGPFIAFMTGVMAECLRVAKPGARALIWAIPRTSHWTGTAIEDAGWIIEDRVSHLFGAGFPKGKSRLKPACEDWWLARKASKGGVPPLNIDECRIPAPGGLTQGGENQGSSPLPMNRDAGLLENRERSPEHAGGRWPANVALSHHPDCIMTVLGKTPALEMARRTEGVRFADDGSSPVAWECVEGCPVAMLDEQTGILTSGDRTGHRNEPKTKNSYGKFDLRDEEPSLGDSGGASRFYFCGKASPADRGRDNTHPTVKSRDLMSWLIRLITQPGDLVLDPFAGSGSTLISCYETDRRAIGIETSEEYVAIIPHRLKDAIHPLFAGLDTVR